MSLWRKLVDLILPRAGTEEAELDAQVEWLDATRPGWDRTGLVAGAERALELFPAELVEKVYGQGLVEEAQRMAQAATGAA